MAWPRTLLHAPLQTAVTIARASHSTGQVWTGAFVAMKST